MVEPTGIYLGLQGSARVSVTVNGKEQKLWSDRDHISMAQNA